MKKINYLSLIFTLIVQFNGVQLKAQEDSPPADPIDTDPAPVLTTIELNEVQAKELFDILNKWKLTVTDRQTQIKKN